MIYKIEFYTYWHCGSGLSGGTTTDALVIKDRDGLPFVPAKTIKGHLREMANLLDKEFEKVCFGEADNKEGVCYFSNAILQDEISPQDAKFLYDTISFTAIDKESKTAIDDSLRSMEATVPLTLVGEILDTPEEYKNMMEKALKMVKRVGMKRHRGFGRCSIEVLEDGNGKNR
jgi:CRISPR/Cas system CSM-associated protein Csm3 (group 7 of RAMP superfamily)